MHCGSQLVDPQYIVRYVASKYITNDAAMKTKNDDPTVPAIAQWEAISFISNT